MAGVDGKRTSKERHGMSSFSYQLIGDVLLWLKNSYAELLSDMYNHTQTTINYHVNDL
jgi:hypothetical protein